MIELRLAKHHSAVSSTRFSYLSALLEIVWFLVMCPARLSPWSALKTKTVYVGASVLHSDISRRQIDKHISSDLAFLELFFDVLRQFQDLALTRTTWAEA